MKLSKTANNGGSVMETRRKQAVQSRNPDPKLRAIPFVIFFFQQTSLAYFQFRISPRFRFKILYPELQIREIPDPKKPIGDPLLRMTCTACLNLAGVKIVFFDSSLISIFFLEPIRWISHFARKYTIDL